ncbi:hypothetical protein ABK040_012356 [Willaertia magna]
MSANDDATSSFSKDQVEKQIEEWKNKLNTFICPITQQLMVDPVIIETGHTFERKSIEEWLKSNNTCPITRTPLLLKSLTPNFTARLSINEKKEKFIKKVIKNIKLWLNDNNLIDICYKLCNETFELIENNENNNYKKELHEIKFDILINKNSEEKELLTYYYKFFDNLEDFNFKFLQLQKLKNKLHNENILQQYYSELLKLLMEINDDDLLFKEIFIKYCTLNKLDDKLIDDIFGYLEFHENTKLEYVIILFNNSNYDRNSLFNLLMNIKTININNEFISFFKNLFKEIDLNKIDLKVLIDFIKDYNELKEEIITTYKELYKKTNKIEILELIYELNNVDKDIELLLLSEYLKLNLTDKYLNLYIKINENKLDTFNIILLKHLQNQNNEINKLKQQNINLESELSNLHNWKEKQVIDKFKLKYRKYKFVKIINIITPLNVEKNDEEYQEFNSDIFKAFGLKWKLSFYPKGNDDSNEDECAIFLSLENLEYNRGEETKEISSVEIDCIICSVNLSDELEFNHNFNDTEGQGGVAFMEKEFTPIIKDDKQIFSVVVGMKKLGIQFK